MRRKERLVTGECYHIFNKSIAKYVIFNKVQEFERMILAIKYYQIKNIKYSFGQFLRLDEVEIMGIDNSILFLSGQNEKFVEILAFCLMPTHIHLVLKQLTDQGISTFMQRNLNSYASYFNKKYKRSGPLWAGRFKNALVESDEQLWHLTRYVHLNPSTAGLIENPQDWRYSSYREYLGMVKFAERLSYQQEMTDVSPAEYKKFVEDQVGYQKNPHLKRLSQK